eukprot:CAMPEP_0117419456 /NCGR_PEP_ID=MMETSP0758-20121206/1004_1 /TAXON_ID=63605 /ORGANISM="Percolomonas cosmopolitus, Strain AE-1 (ATCC 50343)" /LENGTH=831 /DNA_ID=CAMNT_0005200511 /DNA_START=1960 /DNA_END=4458 /DNA_ORIENTATION=-
MLLQSFDTFTKIIHQPYMDEVQHILQGELDANSDDQLMYSPLVTHSVSFLEDFLSFRSISGGKQKVQIHVIRHFWKFTFGPFVERFAETLILKDPRDPKRWNHLLGTLMKFISFPLSQNTSIYVCGILDLFFNLFDFSGRRVYKYHHNNASNILYHPTSTATPTPPEDKKSPISKTATPSSKNGTPTSKPGTPTSETKEKQNMNNVIQEIDELKEKNNEKIDEVKEDKVEHGIKNMMAELKMKTMERKLAEEEKKVEVEEEVTNDENEDEGIIIENENDMEELDGKSCKNSIMEQLVFVAQQDEIQGEGEDVSYVNQDTTFENEEIDGELDPKPEEEEEQEQDGEQGSEGGEKKPLKVITPQIKIEQPAQSPIRARSSSQLITMGVKEIKASSIDKIVEHLIYPGCETNLHFKNMILLTYRSFISIEEFIDTIFSVYHQAAFEDVDLGLNREFEHDAVQRNVVILLSHWVTNHFYDFTNNPWVVLRIIQFLNNEQFDETQNLMNIKLKLTLENMLLGVNTDLKQIATKSRATTIRASLIPHKYVDVLKGHDEHAIQDLMHSLSQIHTFQEMQTIIFEFDEREIARQLTLEDFMTFSKIEPSECFDNIWQKSAGKAPHIIGMTNRFNSLSLWVCNSILDALEHQGLRGAVHTLKKFIRIAMYACSQLHNYNAVKAILAALDNPSLTRLHEVWAMLDAKHTRFRDSMLVKVSHDGRFKEMRALCSAHVKEKVPCIPFLGVYLTTLTHIGLNKDFIKVEYKGETIKLINHVKRKLQATQIADLQKYQHTPYRQIRSIDFLREALRRIYKSPNLKDLNDVYKYSVEIKPRQSLAL